MSRAAAAIVASSNVPRSEPSRGPVPSLARNAAWSLIGNGLYAVGQWLVVVLLAQFGGPAEVGRYALAVALTAPIILCANCALRTVQATDVNDRFQFADYLAFRLSSLAAAAFAMFVAAAGFADGPANVGVVLIVGAGKLVEGCGDLLHGALWRRERLDVVGKSQALRGATTAAAAAFAVAVGGAATTVAALTAASAIIALFAYDLPAVAATLPDGRRSLTSLLRPRWRRAQLAALARQTLPLGITVLLGSLILNVPRYAVEYRLGLEALGIFAALAYFSMAGNLLATSLAQAVLPRWSRIAAAGRRREFFAGVARFSLGATALGALGVAAAWLVGEPILARLYGLEYARYGDVFLVLMSATACGMVVCGLDHALYAARRFRVQLPLNLAVLGVAAAAAFAWTPTYGLPGAASAALVSMAAALLLRVAVLGFVFDRDATPEAFAGAATDGETR